MFILDFITSDFFLLSVILMLIFSMVAQSYNLVLGYTGMIHVGHVAFMAIGAYSSALLTAAGAPFWLGVCAGTAFAGAAGLLLGLPTVRFREDYLVAATLAMGEIIRLVIINERQLTGGSLGIAKIISPEFFGLSLESKPMLLIFVAICAFAIHSFVFRLVRAPFGKVLEAIREDDCASECLGIAVWKRKLQILVIAALIAGFAGGLFAHTIQFIDPESFNLNWMNFVLLIVLFGGAGTFWGPIVGALILQGFFDGMRLVDIPPSVRGPLRWMIVSVVIIALIILKPKGLMGQRLRRKKI